LPLVIGDPSTQSVRRIWEEVAELRCGSWASTLDEFVDHRRGRAASSLRVFIAVSAAAPSLLGTMFKLKSMMRRRIRLSPSRKSSEPFGGRWRPGR
jgi:hypothetical protein